MVYLTAIAMARFGQFPRDARRITAFVIVVHGVGSIWGISGIPGQGDVGGVVLFTAFLICLFSRMLKKSASGVLASLRGSSLRGTPGYSKY
jgi:hypothetical protein